jgi:hypothetical protein
MHVVVTTEVDTPNESEESSCQQGSADRADDVLGGHAKLLETLAQLLRELIDSTTNSSEFAQPGCSLGLR